MAVDPNLESVKKLVRIHYSGLLPTVQCGLAVFGSMSVAGRTRPLSIIFEATSGYGKSAVTQMFFPVASSGLDKYAYRCDKFTPKAFVTHAANVSKEKLSEIDLLPQLRNRVLVTKELAPIFRGREDELKDTFSILIAVLDGKGFVSNSGVQGKRGYEEDIVFNWLGATTPLPRSTHRLMYQLGTRLLFYEVPSIVPDEDALRRYVMCDHASQAEAECREIVNRYLVGFFDTYPVGEVPPGEIEIRDELGAEIARWSQFLAMGRREIVYEHDEPITAATQEGPWKIVDYFKELARGHALIHGRFEVNAEDLGPVSQVAISSIPAYLRPIVRELQNVGKVSSSECERICRVTRPTARKHLLEASLLGLGTLRKGDMAGNTPDVLSLATEFHWLRKP